MTLQLHFFFHKYCLDAVTCAVAFLLCLIILEGTPLVFKTVICSSTCRGAELVSWNSLVILQIERNPKTFLLYDNKRQVYDHVIFLAVSAGQGILEEKEKLCLVYVPFCSLKR